MTPVSFYLARRCQKLQLKSSDTVLLNGLQCTIFFSILFSFSIPFIALYCIFGFFGAPARFISILVGSLIPSGFVASRVELIPLGG